MPARSAWISIIFSSPSRTPASRRSTLPKRSCAPARWTWSWWTPVAALLPAASLKARWARAASACVARLMSQALRKLAGCHLQNEYRRHLHQPAAREDRRYVRQPRNDAGRPRAQILLERPHRHAPHRNAQSRRGNGRQPHAAPRSSRTRSRPRSRRPNLTSSTARAFPRSARSSISA